MILFIVDTAGNKYECEVPLDTSIGIIAADFFESMNWIANNQDGFGTRAVVELIDINGNNPPKRLKADKTIADLHIFENSTLRIYPESIAGGSIDKNQPKKHAESISTDNFNSLIEKTNEVYEKYIKLEYRMKELELKLDKLFQTFEKIGTTDLNKIEKLLKKGNLVEALEELSTIFKELGDIENFTHAIHQMQRLSDLDKSKDLGITSYDDYTKERNKISFAIIGLTTRFKQPVGQNNSKI